VVGGHTGTCNVWASLEQGLCPALQELDISRIPCSGRTMARCLRSGLTGCPDLRRLRLNLYDKSSAKALAAALEQGLYPKLEVLSIQALNTRCHGGEIVAAALRASPRPGLRELELNTTRLGASRVGALQSGACRGLTQIRFRRVKFGQGVNVEGLVEAFAACPRLRHLNVQIPLWGNGGTLCRALAEAVRERGLPELEEVNIGKVREASRL
jgi:hypothetical protein